MDPKGLADSPLGLSIFYSTFRYFLEKIKNRDRISACRRTTMVKV
jgi:hypothetical protein